MPEICVSDGISYRSFTWSIVSLDWLDTVPGLGCYKFYFEGIFTPVVVSFCCNPDAQQRTLELFWKEMHNIYIWNKKNKKNNRKTYLIIIFVASSKFIT